MKNQPYSESINKYELGGELTLQRAENREFVKNWVVYRNMNEDFAQSYTETERDLAGVNFCFWILRRGKRSGGLVMLPNRIGDFFLAPPEEDAKEIVSAVVRLQDTWSDEQKEIRAQAIATPYLKAFKNAGFTVSESRFWMIRPAEVMPMTWSSNWQVGLLDPNKTADIALLLKQAFAGGVGQYGTRDLEAHLRSVESFFEEFMVESDWAEASALIVDKKSKELAAVCLVDQHKGLPSIRFVAVLPEFQRKGLGGSLVKRAVSKLSINHSWVKLAVTKENPAVSLYHKLGFIEGDTLHELIKPPST